ncbi:MAG: hypothetical protein U5L74_03340 [Ideonella sp.]|nr:hypothetical protein [Ideonella sp.]
MNALSDNKASFTGAFWVTLLLCLGLTGLGVRWLQDWGGPLGPGWAAGMAHAQLLSTAYAGLVVLGVLVLRQPLGWALVRGLARWGQWSALRRRSLLLGAVACFLLLVAFLHWAHKLHAIPGLSTGLAAWGRKASVALLSWGWQPVTPSLTSELVRWPACVLAAWLLYRAAHARLAPAVQAFWAMGVVGVLAVSFWVSRDKGPLLVAAMALVCLAAASVRWVLRAHPVWGKFASALAALFTTGGLGLILLLLPLVAPADRVAAWQQPFSAKLEYLAEVTWFLQAAGWQGFGERLVPWCGYLGLVQGRCSALPVAFQSDLTVVALAGLWGGPLAWCVAAAVALALLGLIHLAGQRRPAQGGVDVLGFAAATGALYALLLLAQWAVTVLGSVGLTPLSGVSLPGLSWGRAGVLSLGLALALVWPSAQTRPAGAQGAVPSAISGLWPHVVWVGAWFSMVVCLALAWGLMQRYTVAAPEQTASGRSNPWLPLASCVISTQGVPVKGVGGPCLEDQTRVTVAATLVSDARLQAALGGLARSQPLGEPVNKGGLRIPRRQRLTLTVDADIQARADRLVGCLTQLGSAANTDCAALLPPALQAEFGQRFEGVAARSVTMVTLRATDGALLAAAHARSPCSAQQMAGQAASPHCPPTASVLRARPGRQAHQAFWADDMVSSTFKPLLAEAALRARPRPSSLGPMHQALVSSDTAYFIDQLLCWGHAQPAACTGLAELAAATRRMGLEAPMPLWQAPAGQVALTLPGLDASAPLWPPSASSATLAREHAAARACTDRPKTQRWRGCGGQHLAATLAPLWGQGEARSHPLAVAGLYLRLLAADGGQAQAPAPHLWQDHAPPALPAGFSPAHARFILQALRDVPLVGTAAGACRSVMGPGGCAGKGLAMKTGTSLFPHADKTVEERARHCAAVHAAGGPAREQVACALYPMKWAVLMDMELGLFTGRITVVLAERNWSARTGRLDAPDDRGPNVAAQAALLFLRR